MVYFVWKNVLVFQNEMLSYLFVNPPLDLQILVPFMIVACREFDLRIRSKLVNKMTEEPDEPSAALNEITVNALYGTFLQLNLQMQKMQRCGV